MFYAKTQSGTFMSAHHTLNCDAHGFMSQFNMCVSVCFVSFSLLLINNFHIAAAGVDVRVAIFAHFNFALYQSTLFQADTRA